MQKNSLFMTGFVLQASYLPRGALNFPIRALADHFIFENTQTGHCMSLGISTAANNRYVWSIIFHLIGFGVLELTPSNYFTRLANCNKSGLIHIESVRWVIFMPVSRHSSSLSKYALTTLIVLALSSGFLTEIQICL